MRRILLLSLLFPLLSMCQPLSLNGKLVSENGEPVAGATITIKPDRRSRPPQTANREPRTTMTNNAGEFSISSLQLDDTLLISAVGYQPETVIIDGSYARYPALTLVLRRHIGRMDEVVVNTGYQRLPKERATGSFEFLSNEAFNRQVGSSVLNRLNGMVTSLSVNNGSLQPPLTIRGLSTILGAKAPLLVVDDFPYEGNPENINPADVENITILKDAAAASIWGTRAGNGVIVITTKKGRTNTPLALELNCNTTLASPPDLFYTPQIASADFVELEKFLYGKGYYNSLLRSTARPAVSPVVEILEQKKGGGLTAAEAEAKLEALKARDVRNDFRRYVYQPSVRQQYALTLRGGAPRLTWLVSAGYDKTTSETAAPSNRFTLRLQNSYQLLKTLQFNLSAVYTGATATGGKPTYSSLASASFYPYTQLADDAGNPLPITRSYRMSWLDAAGGGRLLPWNYYPLEDYRHHRVTTGLSDLLLNLGLTGNLGKSLTVELKYNREQQNTTRTSVQDLQSYATRDLVNRFTLIDYTTGTVKYQLPKGGIKDMTDDRLLSQSARTQLSFSRTRGRSSLSALAGAEWREIRTTGSSNRLYGYNEDLVTFAQVDFLNTYPTFINGAQASIPSGISLSDKRNRFVSVFANVAYTFNNRYTLSASARRDASNLFGVATNNKWQPLWSVGAAWTLSAENWYHIGFLPYLKLRATYGFSGNVDQSRAAVTTIAYLGAAATFTNLPQAYISQFANPELRWEKLGTLNLGLDFETKNRVLTGSWELYKKAGTDLFGNAPIDYTTGAGIRLLKNVANMQAQGIDLTLRVKMIDRVFRWETTFLGSYHTSRVTRYNPTSARGFDYLSNGNSITAMEGKPVYSVLSFRWAGLDSLGNPRGLLNGKPTTVYADLVGAKTTVTDLVYSGPALPTLFGSVQNSFSWKGVSVTVALQYKLGYYFRRASIDYGRLFSQATGHSDFALRWQAPGDEYRTSVPSLIYPSVTNRDVFYNNAEVLVEKGDHLRLQFIQLTADLPERLRDKLHLRAAQLYGNAANLGLLWKANHQGIDPDYLTSIPPSPAFSVGIRTSF